ncbi:hypothetical protein [Hyalangium sp.]|uniref:hypothetical protein n=1 Tax=Hyalangium sp. TaxID=2028555 RepID=UPI002D50D38C|nr:hypothetical protein [Hyalangium sp.]HYI02580.1 hypothetical protein [Hyalangium sp.]
MEHRCTECGEVATEPRLRYCEQCGAKMPEFKPPPLAEVEAQGGGGGTLARARPARPAYTGPKWLEHVPAHSPTLLGVILHMVALVLSILPSMAGPGPFWSFVMVVGSVFVVAREYRYSGEPNPLVDWVPESFYPPAVPAAYAALAAGFSLPMLEFSFQPLLWIGGTVLVARDQWGKVFAGRGGLSELFEPRALVRGQRILAFAGVVICVLALFFTWHVEGEVSNTGYRTAAERVRIGEVPRPAVDSVYGGEGGLRVSGMHLPIGSTVQLGLLALLVLLMLRPEVDRPIWLRFVPAGITVIAVAWVLVNMDLKVGPIMFLGGLLPVGLVAAFQAIGRDDQLPAGDYAEEPPPEAPLPEDTDMPVEEDFPPEGDPVPEDEEDMRG